MMAPVDRDIADPSLAAEGRSRIEWALQQMPVLRGLTAHFERERPLAGVRISACLRVTTETADLARALAAGGASIRLCASKPLSTQNDVAAALVEHWAIPVFARRGVDAEGYYRHIEACLAHPGSGPAITLDDGADLVTTLHTRRRELLEGIVGLSDRQRAHLTSWSQGT